jgi:hypothetical protein
MGRDCYVSLALPPFSLQIRPHNPAITEAEAEVAWVKQSQAVMVAVDASGALVANAGYVVAEHSLHAARRLGFRLMPFTLVVSTNAAGIRCWQRNGFQVVGTLPGAFRPRRLGYVDALVMVHGLAGDSENVSGGDSENVSGGDTKTDPPLGSPAAGGRRAWASASGQEKRHVVLPQQRHTALPCSASIAATHAASRAGL